MSRRYLVMTAAYDTEPRIVDERREPARWLRAVHRVLAEGLMMASSDRL